MNPEVMAGIVMGLMVGSFLGHFFTRQFDRKLRHFGIDMGEWEGYRQKRGVLAEIMAKDNEA